KHIDFLVYPPQGTLFADAFLWAESKKEITDIPAMFAQLLLTIKKTVDAGEILPPNYLGVFDKERFACIEFHYVLPIFHRSDFNWNEKPSNVSDATVKIVEQFLTEEALLQFDFKNDEAELMKFIQINFAAGRECTSKIQITKNNFVTVFMKWSASVRPSIDFSYDDQRRYGLIDGDFYLGDLLSEDNLTLPDFKDLNVVLQHDYYKIKVKIAGAPRRLIEEISFRDGGKAHKLFWEKYQRPPKEEFRDYMKDRRDLLVPQDVRERKGSFFTPKIWVEKSQEYLEKVFGENWQDEYYIWDCCCGTGNLLAGLVNPHNVWASTIDQADIDILHTSISNKKCNLPEPHVFQFDFLNGNFNDLPEGLRNVINDTEKQKKLIIYINPPYGEGGNYTGRTKAGVSKNYSVNQELKPLIGRAANEMFALFFGHIRQSMPTANLAAFASVKYVNAYNFRKFRAFFKSRYRGGYICLANTFDNVQGGFPIGFLVWSFSSQKFPQKIQTDVFNPKGYHIGRKNFYSENQFINEWIDTVKCGGQTIGFLSCKLNELQYNQYVCICNTKGQLPYGCKSIPVTNESLIESCIYLAVRHSIGLVIPHKDKWICHNDPFLFPDKKFKRNVRFLNDCLIFALFHEKNKITSKDGINHWIPFSAKEVKAKDNFRSSFMPDYIKERGRFSKEAVTVLEAGKALWTYYHETIRNVCGATADASLYEIREYFKERNEQGRMNTKSADDQFNVLDKTLRDAVKALAKQIEPKVYEYGFLLQ
ncbi:MAG: hypothetical protein LBT46_06375, partial [Planctomycetaceae bacterium]|nr:hypothetical protein [Planctomycetaceae bacterium]